jgi:hypothetical protein
VAQAEPKPAPTRVATIKKEDVKIAPKRKK